MEGCRKCGFRQRPLCADSVAKVFLRHGSQILRGVGAALDQRCGDHVATRRTDRRFWQRVCGSIEQRLSLVSFFGDNLPPHLGTALPNVKLYVREAPTASL